MKKFALLIFGVFSIALFSQSKTILSSEIRWKAYKTLRAESLSHFGTVNLKSGTLIFNGDDLAGGSFVMDMKSIDAADMNEDPKMKKMLENHLKSDDFFDTNKFPTASFQIKSLKKINSNGYNYQVTGPLTIKGISKNISFPVKVSQSNAVYTLTSAQFTFNRKNYGLKYNIFEDMLIINDVEMNVTIKAK
ncbi:YceI family protein [Kaistella flava (ex Peng et al. 2021)]|uniref:YceI family protein n=1 Tax=Kaistella flava (ex Peng et al. 2021) TaxID=2038776 RepID=A0A7M2Y4Y7_9FLAO|nr:YceI family protein [Kaistella flava (ex Peng et al. 2021)]QOW09308.1 YceI family protein [Kaistella flava (ex Peng et al. 2021)]